MKFDLKKHRRLLILIGLVLSIVVIYLQILPRTIKEQETQRRIKELENRVDYFEEIKIDLEKTKIDLEELKKLIIKKDTTNDPIIPVNIQVESLYQDRPALGDASAPLVLWAFLDFQCAPCKAFATKTLKKLEEEFVQSKQLRIVVRDFPLSSNQHARKAAELANCAGEQSKYWEAFRWLFDDIQRVDFAEFDQITEAIPSLNSKKLEQCQSANKYNDRFDKDIDEARKLGAKGAPSFFLGRIDATNNQASGMLIRGAQPIPVFRHEIQTMLHNLMRPNK